jgi:hypothetical protein
LKATFMKLLPSRFLLSLLLAAGAVLSPARAQPNAPAAPAAAAAPPALPTPPAPGRSDPTVSLDFPGGSLGDLIALVGKTNGETALNVIGEKAALSTEVQAFTVRNADRDALLRAIGELLRSKGVRVQGVGGGVFIVSSDSPKDRRPTHPRSEVVFDSFQLGSYLDDQQSVDNIVDVIRSAWTMNPAHDANALQVKFHPGTKLLLVSGPPEAIEMTRQLIRSLHQSRQPLNAEEKRLLEDIHRRGSAPPPLDNK